MNEFDRFKGMVVMLTKDGFPINSATQKYMVASLIRAARNSRINYGTMPRIVYYNAHGNITWEYKCGLTR